MPRPPWLWTKCAERWAGWGQVAQAGAASVADVQDRGHRHCKLGAHPGRLEPSGSRPLPGCPCWQSKAGLYQPQATLPACLQGLVELTDRLSIQKAIAMRVRDACCGRCSFWGRQCSTAARHDACMDAGQLCGVAALPCLCEAVAPPGWPLCSEHACSTHTCPQLPYEPPAEKSKGTLAKLMSSKASPQAKAQS